MLEQGIHLISTDEMTGIQALERLFPNKRIKPKQVEKIEFEYERHGTLSLIANWDVARGKVVSPSIGPTRTEQDFSEHIQRTIKIDEKAEWIFIVDLIWGEKERRGFCNLWTAEQIFYQMNLIEFALFIFPNIHRGLIKLSVGFRS